MTGENALWSSCCLSQNSWLYALRQHCANQIYKPLPPTATLDSQPKKCTGGSSSVEEQWHLVPGASPAAGDTAHLATNCLSSSTSPVLQETSPCDILRAFTFRVKDKGRRLYLDARIGRNQEQQRTGSLTEKQVLELSDLQTPIFQQCSDIWIKYH